MAAKRRKRKSVHQIVKKAVADIKKTVKEDLKELKEELNKPLFPKKNKEIPQRELTEEEAKRLKRKKKIKKILLIVMIVMLDNIYCLHRRARQVLSVNRIYPNRCHRYARSPERVEQSEFRQNACRSTFAGYTLCIYKSSD